MRSFYRKRKMIFILLVVVGILSLSSVTYAIFNVTTSQSGTNEISTMKCLELSFSNQENNINLVNTYPMTDERGAKNTPYTFTITNNCEAYIEYSIGLMIDEANTLEDKYVKTMFSLKDDIGEAVLLTNREEGKVYNDNKTYLFRRDGLANGASKEYKLRLWVDGSGTAETVTNKSFNSKIIINAYPKSEEGKINISTNLDGGHLYQELNEVYREGDKVKLPIPAKEGHSFKAWEVVSGDGTINEGILTVGSENITIKATYKVGITITLDLDGGSSNQVFNPLYYEGDEILLQPPTLANSMFIDWEIVSGDGIINNNVLLIRKESIVLKANWQSNQTEYLFDYTGGEQVFVAPVSAYYSLEAWGAQGGNVITSSNTYVGGYGGYSEGIIYLNKGETLYINIGGQGANGTSSSANTTFAGGYNGGGNGLTFTTEDGRYAAGGGGATHISLKSGILSSLSNNTSSILIVSGGGAGNGYYNDKYYNVITGSGGGISGSSGVAYYSTGNVTHTGGNQISGNSFGSGAGDMGESPGGGGGYYGGTNGSFAAGGGSGYIGNEELKNKTMYCYNCETSNNVNTKTISTTCTNSLPIKNCAKQGNGYAKITFIKANNYSATYSFTGNEQSFVVPKTGTYKLETWGAQGGNVITSSNTYTGGYGGYSYGTVQLTKNNVLYINIGGQGTNGTSGAANTTFAGGYNGGGNGLTFTTGDGRYAAGGGGATHISLKSGILSSLSNDISSILIVSGGGAGNSYLSSSYYNITSGSGGGIEGTTGVASYSGTNKYFAGGSQTSGSAFGQGAGNTSESPGGGGGYYGGNNGTFGAGGGSGYIGNPLLTNKAMYCYNCTTSNETSTKTISTTCAENNATVNCAKKGSGYVKITYIS